MSNSENRIRIGLDARQVETGLSKILKYIKNTELAINKIGNSNGFDKVKRKIEDSAKAQYKLTEGYKSQQKAINDTLKLYEKESKALDSLNSKKQKLATTAQSQSAKEQTNASQGGAGNIVSTVLQTGAVLLPVKIAIDLEAEFANVASKLPEGTTKAVQRQIKNDLENFATTTGLDVVSTFRAAEKALMFGVPVNELKSAVLLSSELALAFDMTADAGGEVVGKLKTITGTLGGVRRVGDTINYLSNTYGMAASDLTEFSLRTLPIAKIIGITENATLSLGAAMLKAGTEPERASTAFLSLAGSLGIFNSSAENIAKLESAGVDTKALRKGMDQTKALMQIAGIDFQKLSSEFKINPDIAMKSFISSVSKIKDKGLKMNLLQGIFGTLGGDVSLEMANLSKLFPEMATEITAIMDAANDASKTQGSLTKEATAKTDTMRVSIQNLKDSLVGLGDAFASPLLAGKNIVQLLAEIITKMSDLVRAFPFVSAGLFTLFSGAVLAKVAIMALRFLGITTSIRAIGTASLGAVPGVTALGVSMSRLSSALGIIGAITTALLLAIDAGKLLGKFIKDYNEGKAQKESQKGFTKVIPTNYNIASEKETFNAIQNLDKPTKTLYNSNGKINPMSGFTNSNATLPNQLKSTALQGQNLSGKLIIEAPAGYNIKQETPSTSMLDMQVQQKYKSSNFLLPTNGGVL
jgi:TP901 family phage tail tape measure protein